MTIVVSGGKAAQVKQWPFDGGGKNSGPSAGVVPLIRGNRATTFDGMYKSQPMVHAVVSKRVKASSRIPLKAYQFGVDGDTRSRVRSGGLALLLQTPHPRGSTFSLKAKIAYSLDVHGAALLWKYRPSTGAAPTELWPVDWKYVRVLRDARGPVGYELHLDGNTYPLGVEDVVHFEQAQGVSPLEPLRRTLALDDAALDYQTTALASGSNGGRVVFRTDNKLTDDAMARLRAELSVAYSGPENAGRPIVVDQGLDAKPLNVTAADMELIAQRKLSRDEVCAVYDMPPALLGLEAANYSSVAEYRKALYDSIAADLSLIESTLNAQLVRTEPSWDGLFVEHDANELLRVDLLARAQAHMLMQQAGIETRNEARQVENLPPIDDPLADTIFVPLNMAPLDGSGTLPAAGGADRGVPGGTPMQGFGDRVADPASMIEGTV